MYPAVFSNCTAFGPERSISYGCITKIQQILQPKTVNHLLSHTVSEGQEPGSIYVGSSFLMRL